MRIHDQIRANSTLRKWKIFLLKDCTTYTFLPMSTAELVSKLNKAHSVNIVEHGA